MTDGSQDLRTSWEQRLSHAHFTFGAVGGTGGEAARLKGPREASALVGRILDSVSPDGRKPPGFS